jgi:hypothetical protein
LRSLFVFDGPVHGLDRGLHVQEPLTGLFGLAALVGTGEHFNKRSPLLDQSRSRLFEIVGVLFAHSHGPSLTETQVRRALADLSSQADAT